MTFISLVKCCSNIIEYSSTQKGPRKVSSFTAGFSPSEIVGIIMFFLQGIIIDVLILRSSFYAHDAEVLDFDIIILEKYPIEKLFLYSQYLPLACAT